jgi:hypothetical protein
MRLATKNLDDALAQYRAAVAKVTRLLKQV